ncbi:MAG: ABC transporter ATP-binding protein/permease [Candidatus Thorarchaeota archaeon]|nr:ABC transporter ATP-binding protein/permease [Candidatus Thorarchaeota archaeon]
MGYIRRLTGYALRRKTLFFAFLSSSAIGTMFNLLTPLVIIQIVDTVILGERLDLLIPYTLLFVGLGTLYTIFDMLGRYGAAVSSQHVIYSLREELYESLMEKDLSFYDQNETGQLLARVTTDVSTMREFLYWGYRVIFIGAAQLLGTYIVMWSVNTTLTTYMLLWIPVTFLFIYSFAKKVRPVFYAARQQYGVLSSVLAENVVGHKVVRAYAAEERETRRVEQENRGFLNLWVKASKLEAFFQSMLPALFGMATGFLIYLGGYSIVENLGLTLGEFVGFISLVGMLLLPARFLSWGVGMYQRASASGERTFYILDSIEEVMDPENPVMVSELQGAVDFNNISFSYGGEGYILRDVNLHVKPGQIVALLGGTGSGKTSLVNLIPRFYDVDTKGKVLYQEKAYKITKENTAKINGKDYPVIDGYIEIDGQKLTVDRPGNICVDGIDIRQYALNDLRKFIGMVHQDPFLFSATLRENISFGRPEASDEEVIEAAKAAMIHDFIVTLEKGYESEVGERGVTLSGGQKQRIAIARALLANPKILVLDDSTSSVDAKTEMLIQKALENLMKGRTTFIITHRLSTVRNANLIVMMERGQIVEVGSHEELIEREGQYHNIHQTLAEMELAAAVSIDPFAQANITGGGASE